MNIAEKYIDGLKKAYIEYDLQQKWDDFESVIHGASEEDIQTLVKIYPDTPKSLLNLFGFVDGTYWREYKGEEIIFYFLGSDIEQYPYYLLSASQIIETQNDAFKYYGACINREYDKEDVKVDERIIDNADKLNWLHFSDCTNNGGTSQLFIDFSPSPQGTKGQVVQLLHDPDEFSVIADSFDEYLQKIIDNEYDFLFEDDCD